MVAPLSKAMYKRTVVPSDSNKRRIHNTSSPQHKYNNFTIIPSKLTFSHATTKPTQNPLRTSTMQSSNNRYPQASMAGHTTTKNPYPFAQTQTHAHHTHPQRQTNPPSNRDQRQPNPPANRTQRPQNPNTTTRAPTRQPQIAVASSQGPVRGSW